jgi:pimeloyl-ACP methyl ester carboxylesterase
MAGQRRRHYLSGMRIRRILAALALVATACHSAPPPAAPPSPATPTAATVATAPPTPPPAPRECEWKKSKTKPSGSGDLALPDGRSLHWVKLTASQQPARGTLVYLAGGPISHMMYVDMAARFQKAAYADLDVLLYDYAGFNCSGAIQDATTLRAQASHLTMAGMADDFVALKHALVGDKKVFLMGGSHGSMIGAEIVATHPEEIEKAVLFSGDTESGWLWDGWFRFDRVLAKLDKENAGFGASLEKLLAAAKDRARLEVALWVAFSLDSAAQKQLPMLVKAAEAGKTEWIDRIVRVTDDLLSPPKIEEAPTEVSMGTTFHRCNVWFPKSARAKAEAAPLPKARFLHGASFLGYWDALCRDYDALGEHPLHAVPAKPTDVPVLSWIGDRDTFDEARTKAHWSALTTKLDFRVMPGWSHDLGPDPAAGFGEASKLVKEFLR